MVRQQIVPRVKMFRLLDGKVGEWLESRGARQDESVEAARFGKFFGLLYLTARESCNGLIIFQVSSLSCIAAEVFYSDQ